MTSLRISPGFSESERATVARLYWQAFSGKLGRVMQPKAKALAYLEQVLDPQFALSARTETGLLVGVAGFKTSTGELVRGGPAAMTQVYGRFGALWRSYILSLLERDTVTDTLLLDGIFVADFARGMGAGTALLREIKQEALRRGVSSVRLDVIDSNHRARALYEREGFVATATDHIGPLRHIFGFRSATRMICPVSR